MFYTSLVSFRHYHSILRQTFQPDPPPLTPKFFTRNLFITVNLIVPTATVWNKMEKRIHLELHSKHR